MMQSWLLFSFVLCPHFPTNTIIKNYFYIDATKEFLEVSSSCFSTFSK